MGSVRELNLEKLWSISQAFVVSSFFRGYGPWLDELKSQASESFVLHVNGYDEWCEKHGYNASDEGLFYALAKKRIRWDCLAYMDNVHGRKETGTEEEWGEIRTQLSVRHRDSLLHHQLASFVETLPLRERVYLALVAFEEIPVTKIAPLVEGHHVTIGKAIRTGAERVLLEAMRLTMTGELPKPEPTGRTRWVPPTPLLEQIERWYGCDLDTYLEYVQIHYRADVSYLVEILDRANGGGPQRGNLGNNRKLTADQVQEVITRLYAKEKHEDIARDYGVTRGAITQLKKRYGVAA